MTTIYIHTYIHTDTVFTVNICTLYWLHTYKFTIPLLHTKLFAEFTQTYSEVTENTHFPTIYVSQTYIYDPKLTTYVSQTTIYDVHNTNMTLITVITFLSAINWGQGVFLQVRLTSRRVRIDREWPQNPPYSAISDTYSVNSHSPDFTPRDNPSFLNQLSGLS